MKLMWILFLSLFISVEASSQLWDSLSAGLNRPPRVSYFDSATNKLFAGGTFTSAGREEIWGIASWDGTKWDSLGSGIDHFSGGPNVPATPWAITRFGSYLYVGGGFKKAGGVESPALARWNGSVWDSVPGLNLHDFDLVADILVYNGELYICGVFDSVAGAPANSIATWDGFSWNNVGPNYPFSANGGIISCMQYYNGNLYVAGHFDDSTGASCDLARWNGAYWEFMCNAIQGSAGVNEMVVYNGELIVGGVIYQSDGNPGNAIQKWNDTIWTDVGGSAQAISFNPQVYDMEIHNGKLYCAGTFQMMGGVVAKGLAVWDGTNWCSFGTDFCYAPQQQTGVGTVSLYNDTMIVTGAFLTTNGDSTIRVAQWIGGSFVDTCGNATAIAETITEHFSVNVYPNPASTNVIFTFPNDQESRRIILYDQLGREIWREETTANLLSISVSDFADGIYFYSIQDAEGSKTNGKFVVAH